MSKRIALLTTSYPRFPEDESSVFVKRLVEGYDLIGCSGVVVVPFDRDEKEHERQGNFEIFRYKYGLFTRGKLAFGSGIMPNLRNNPFLMFQIPFFFIMMVVTSYLHRSRYDVLHANWVFTAFAAWCVSLLTGKPYLVTIRGEDIRLLRNKFFRFLVLPALTRANCVAGVSDAFRDELRDLVPLPQEKLITVPNGVFVPDVNDEEVSRFCSQYNLDPQEKYLLFVGRVLRLKRVHLLIELLSFEQLSEYRLIICGRVKSERYFRELQEQVASLGVESRVSFTGAVSPTEVACSLSLARYYLSASETEGRSNSVLEALFAGVPVMLTDIPGHREVTKDGEAGYLFHPAELREAADFINTLDREPALYQKASEAGKSFVKNLTWAKTAQDYLRAFTN